MRQRVALLFGPGPSFLAGYLFPACSKDLGDSKPKACSDGIDDEIVDPGVPAGQCDLAQFQSKRESEHAWIQPANALRISESQQEAGRAKRDEMLQVVLDSADRPFICRDDG